MKLKNEQLQKVDKSKNKMFSILSHDLKSPISSLLQLIQLLKEEAFPKEERQEVLNEMHLQLTSTSLMLRNLLKWATNQMENDTIKYEFVDIKKCVDEILVIYLGIAKSKNVKIIHDKQSVADLKVNVDPSFTTECNFT
ncbi:histidine kinase dimerization/phospho-acceptor domain-containing protein [Mesonia aestuariivivens]|uniref:histidine kinase n=1 Tax=Mesonia aestuariivivens TaxID=2796128 RepID=A0ABS6W1W2_9FLAO|nr:histidine kinase dimerization/phospho-acceptor domain-containing protein [Mesonia aestuariivivens]MBW2961807.1 hypothetical protein [Mesonia aestuariivivens]